MATAYLRKSANMIVMNSGSESVPDAFFLGGGHETVENGKALETFSCNYAVLLYNYAHAVPIYLWEHII